MVIDCHCDGPVLRKYPTRLTATQDLAMGLFAVARCHRVQNSEPLGGRARGLAARIRAERHEGILSQI
jgi:hypothetical protein